MLFRSNAFLRLSQFLLLLTVLSSCKSDTRETISSLEDLKGKKVVVTLGSTQDEFLNENYPEIELFRVDALPDVVAPLITGHASAILTDGFFIEQVIRTYPDIVLVGDVVYEEPYGMSFRDHGLNQRFNAFLSRLKESGELEAIFQKWVDDPETAELPQLSLSGGNGILQVVANYNVPMIFLREGKEFGIDVEILLRFCAEEGYVPKFKDVSFSSALMAITTDSADVLCGGVTITEERKKSIDFTDPYYISLCMVAVMRDKVAGTDAGQSGEEIEKGSFWSGLKDSFHNNLIREKRYLLIVDGFKVTVAVSFFSALFGTILGCLVCFMKMRRRRWIRRTADLYIGIVRGIPQLVLLMVMFYIVFASTGLSGAVVAVITFSINFSAYSSEIFHSAILGIDKGQTEAGVALGFSKLQTFVYIIAPQALRRALPVFKGEIVSLIKMTSIIGYIAVQDLTKASDIIRSRTFDAFFPLIFVAVIYFLLSYFVAFLISLIEKKYERDN